MTRLDICAIVSAFQNVLSMNAHCPAGVMTFLAAHDLETNGYQATLPYCILVSIC